MKCPICSIECEKHIETTKKEGIEEAFEFVYYTCPNCYGIFESKQDDYE